MGHGQLPRLIIHSNNEFPKRLDLHEPPVWALFLCSHLESGSGLVLMWVNPSEQVEGCPPGQCPPVPEVQGTQQPPSREDTDYPSCSFEEWIDMARLALAGFLCYQFSLGTEVIAVEERICCVYGVCVRS